MRQTAIDLVRRFPQMRVFVIGDALLDTYLEGEASRLCREGPVPLLWKTCEQHNPGGAANVAANLHALHAQVSFVSVVGKDYAGGILRHELEAVGLDTCWMLEDTVPMTPHKLRILAEGQYVIRLDDGARQDGTMRPTNEGVRERLHACLEERYRWCDLVMISDYNYGVLSDGVIEQMRELVQRDPKPVLIDSQALLRFRAFPATVITPNEAEARRVVELAGQTPSLHWEHLAQQLHAILCVEAVVITLADQGVYLRSHAASSGTHLPTHPVEHAQDVGAGDSFASAMAAAFAAGGTLEEAAQIGIDAAGIAVTQPRTALVSHQKLLQRVSVRVYSQIQNNREQGTLERLAATLAVLRLNEKRIVFTNGVFDRLNVGHLQFLRQAKALGDVLVVGINTDESALLLKGMHPITNEEDRLALISALDMVDYALLFDDETARKVIRVLQPDIVAKGGDYTEDQVPEADVVREVGGEIVILPLIG